MIEPRPYSGGLRLDQGIRRHRAADLDHRLAAPARVVRRRAGRLELSRGDDERALSRAVRPAVSVHLRAQETAGLDICTDGDAHFDDQVGGMSWQSYPLTHMSGLSA